MQIFITINGCLLVLHQIQMLTHPLDQHLKSNGVLSALRDDHVGTALARLYELLVHRFYGRQVLRHNAVQGTAALFYIAQDPAENPHVRIGIDKRL